MGRIGFFLAGVGIAALAAPAFAQDAPPQTPPEGPGLQDIVVTAQRRSERLQDVPVAITAAGAQQLATARVENIANVAAISPSVQFTAGNISTSTANIQIRGLGTTGNSRSFEGAVGVFIDGVYRTRAAAALQNFNDIDNLQILRGPQGTLFGKNTSAGAVLISSTAPELDRVEGKYEIGYGNFDTFLAKGAVNVPLSENAAIRVAGLYSTRDGIYKDVNTGKRLNGDETYAFKGQFLFEPVDTVKIRLIGDYSRGHGACCYATSNLVDGPTQPLVDALTLALGLKTPSTRLKDYEVALNHPGNQVVKDYGGTLLTDIELGGDTLKSVTALRKFSVIQTDVDPDFSGADIFSLDEDFASRFFSQELTYNGKISSLNANYVLGAFYSNEKLSMARATRWGSQGQVYWDTLLSAAGLPPGTVYAAPGTWATEAMGGRSRSYAAFAHFDFKVGDKWNLIAGLRYSIEKKSGFFFNPFYRSEPNDVFRVLGVQPGPAYNASRTDKALSGTFGIQYHPSRDAMIYLTYNRGFKAGGVNMDANAAGLPANNPAEVPGATPLDPTYRPEKVDAVELGAKIEYLDRRARTNVAVFYNHVSDLQVAQFIGLQFAVLNAKSAETYGLEIENLFKINDAVTLGLDGTWLPKAAFGDDPNIDPVLSGHRFRYASKFTGNATVNLDQPITDDLSLTGRVQYQYTGPQLYNTASLVRRSAVSLVNANLGIKSGRGGWQVEAWVQNLFDKIYGTFAFNTPLQTGDENVYLAAPRTFGLTLRGNF